MPKVSIVITTHNRRQLLERAIDSAFKTKADVEVIVVDDASTDDTKDFCGKLSNIKYIRLEHNQRTAGARNVGLLVADAAYILFLDDDDWLLPNLLDEQLLILDNEPECGIVYGQMLFADHKGNILDESPYPSAHPQGDVLMDMLESNHFGIMTAVIRKKAFLRVGLFDMRPEMYGIEDWDMWIRIAEIYKFKSVCKPVAVYRKPAVGTGQWSSNIAKQFSLVANAYKTKWLGLPGVKKLLGKNLEKKKSSLLDAVADLIIYDMAQNSSGIFEKASKTSVALRCYPSKVTQLKFYKTIVKSYLSK